MNAADPLPGQVLEIHVCAGESNIIGVCNVDDFVDGWHDLLFDDDEQRPTINRRVAWRGIVHETGAYLMPLESESAVRE